jgi:ribosome-binding factor A
MSRRTQRLNELIKVELGNIFLREVEFPVGSLVTITRVQTAEDLMSVKIFISVFPEKSATPVFRMLNARIYFLQQKLNRKLPIRPVPRIVFYQESEIVAVGRIEQLLEEVKQGSVDPVKSGQVSNSRTKIARSNGVEKRKNR